MIRVDRNLLRDLAKDTHVDSPIYHTGSWPVRELQWRKLEALISMTSIIDVKSWGKLQGRVLDLCCGNGVLLPALSKMFGHVDAIDIHTTAARRLVRALMLDNVKVYAANVYSMPYADSSYDCIFAASCLEHFVERGPINREIQRVLKPGGHLYVLTPTENLLYCFGRKLLGYTKPIDHYWTAKQIENGLEAYFKPITLKSYPSAMLPIYRLGVYRKHD